jgi:hypothetical protein
MARRTLFGCKIRAPRSNIPGVLEYGSSIILPNIYEGKWTETLLFWKIRDPWMLASEAQSKKF